MPPLRDDKVMAGSARELSRVSDSRLGGLLPIQWAPAPSRRGWLHSRFLGDEGGLRELKRVPQGTQGGDSQRPGLRSDTL